MAAGDRSRISNTLPLHSRRRARFCERGEAKKRMQRALDVPWFQVIDDEDEIRMATPRHVAQMLGWRNQVPNSVDDERQRLRFAIQDRLEAQDAVAVAIQEARQPDRKRCPVEIVAHP